MMRMEVKSFQMPRWVLPVALLAVLALIPFAVILAFSLAALTAVVSIVRAFLPPLERKPLESNPFRFSPPSRDDLNTDVIDADYEVKDQNEKTE